MTAGTFHDFHVAWIAELRRVLNAGLLPEGYYAMAEQVAGPLIPDVLTLQDQGPGENDLSTESPRSGTGEDDGGVAIAEARPKVSLHGQAQIAPPQRHIAIRHTTGDRIVALLEIVSPGNKDRKPALEQFVSKAYRSLRDGYNLLVIDLLPPGPFDPNGIHGAIWAEFDGGYEAAADKPLTLAAYSAGPPPYGQIDYYVEPTAVGKALIPMPLFLSHERYVNVPLEPTYLAAYEGVPKRWKQVIEGKPQ